MDEDEISEASVTEQNEADHREAAPNESVSRTEPTADTRSHLTSCVPKAAKAPIGVLTKGEIGELRAIFSKLSDAEIQKLYKRVTKQN